MLTLAEKTLARYAPAKTIVLIGATREGIGAVYDLAKSKGFTTAGIVSSQAKVNNVAFSPCVDHVFVVEDATWGGIDPKTKRLSPTSAAMVENSDVMVAFGGGDIARDELTAARRAGKPIEFHAADMNHKIAFERAKKRVEPAPTDFSGSAAAVFGKR
jgi:NADPH:quinone reductase-like Zn-dependent oxidoreductase